MAVATLTFPAPGPVTLAVASVVRDDTDTPVMGVLSGGPLVWVLTVADPAPNLNYDYALLGTWADGSTATVRGEIAGVGVVPPGDYCNLADLKAECGPLNTLIYADPDNAGDALLIAGQESDAITFGGVMINTALSRDGYATPATVQLPMLRIIARKFAAWQLYQVRGMGDDKVSGKFQVKYDWAMEQLTNLLDENAGGFTEVTGGPSNMPQDVSPVYDAYGTPIYPAVLPNAGAYGFRGGVYNCG